MGIYTSTGLLCAVPVVIQSTGVSIMHICSSVWYVSLPFSLSQSVVVPRNDFFSPEYILDSDNEHLLLQDRLFSVSCVCISLSRSMYV